MEFTLAQVMEKAQLINSKAQRELAAYEDKIGKTLELKSPSAELFKKDGRIKIVFVGQYSAGKSTILRMLTGNMDIAVGAGITTQSSSVYEWKNIEIVDTPGIATGIRMDHDKLAYEAIAEADLLVFVITNELFSPLVLENFKKLAYDLTKGEDIVHHGKANEMILVVNKMERIGNTTDKQDMLLKALYEVGVPENMTIGFVDAQSYVESLEEEDEELKEELIDASGYRNFEKLLNTFAEDKGLLAKVVSPIKSLQDYLYKAVDLVEVPIDDPEIAASEQMLKSAIKLLRSADREGRRQLEDIFDKYAHEIRRYGNELAENIESIESEEQAKSEIEAKMKEIVTNCKREVEDEIQVICERIDRDITAVINPDLVKGIDVDIEGPNKDSFDYKGIADKLGKGTQKVLEKFNKDLILEIGHLLGHKFKPWEALKYFKWIEKLNKWLPLIGQLIDFIFEIVNREKKEEALRTLQNMRREVRNSFDSAACELERNGREFIKTSFGAMMNQFIEEQNKELEKFDTQRKNQSDIVAKFKGYIKETNQILKEL